MLKLYLNVLNDIEARVKLNDL